MADRPYLTTAEAAAYCGFKTIGGIQQAVRRGKLKPAGRRGGTGTFVFTRDDLDAFLTGGLAPHGRLFMPPPDEADAAPAAPAYQSRSRGSSALAATTTSSPPRRRAEAVGDSAPSGSVTGGATRRSRKSSKAKEPVDPIDRICRALDPVRTKEPKSKKSKSSANSAQN